MLGVVRISGWHLSRSPAMVKAIFANIFFLLLTGATPSAGAESPAGASSPVQVFYITNRAPIMKQDGSISYGSERSHELTFGNVSVFGPDAETSIVGTPEELGRFPATPYDVIETKNGAQRDPDVVARHLQAARDLKADLSRRVMATGRKEVIVFIHGYNNSFDDAVRSTAQLCTDLGPQDFTCVALTWPAGGTKGVLFGYNVDRESGEFSVSDVRKALRFISETPGLREMHFLGHSRGTDVLSSALKELSIETYVSQTPLGSRKAGNVLLFAPDMDLDVAFSKLFTPLSDPGLLHGRKADPNLKWTTGDIHYTIYASDGDQALALSQFLFGSELRLGRFDVHNNPELMRLAPHFARLTDFVSVEGGEGLIGHSYFLSNPHVRADITALIRDRAKAGSPERPLREIQRPFWFLPNQ
jgi:esterase/lipase superfamily enzyme